LKLSIVIFISNPIDVEVVIFGHLSILGLNWDALMKMKEYQKSEKKSLTGFTSFGSLPPWTGFSPSWDTNRVFFRMKLVSKMSTAFFVFACNTCKIGERTLFPSL